jgi:hypothetical protein
MRSGARETRPCGSTTGPSNAPLTTDERVPWAAAKASAIWRADYNRRAGSGWTAVSNHSSSAREIPGRSVDGAGAGPFEIASTSWPRLAHTSPTTHDLNAVAGLGSDVWIVGAAGTVLHLE